MKTPFTLHTRVLALLLSLSSLCPAQYLIDRGCIKGDFTIKFEDKDITLSPDNFFSMEKLRLKSNPPSGKDLRPDGYKRKDLVTYKIKIEKLSSNKVYYGRIAFYAVVNKPKIISQAVVSYFKLSIPESYFMQAHDGITASVYEYYINRRKKVDHQFPTWVIWFSDVPL